MDKLIQLHSLEEFKEAIQNKSIVVFSTDWCPDCLYMKTYIEHVVELRKTEEEVQSFIDSI